jgi:hypothetical protein
MHCFTTNDPTNINDAIRRGFLFCALESDISYVRAGVKNALGGVVGWKPGDIGEKQDL